MGMAICDFYSAWVRKSLKQQDLWDVPEWSKLVQRRTTGEQTTAQGWPRAPGTTAHLQMTCVRRTLLVQSRYHVRQVVLISWTIGV